jgi:ribonuclease VapC
VVVDTSALVALLLAEPSAPAVARCMERARRLVISAATLVETTIVVEARLGPDGVLRLDQVLREAEIVVAPVDVENAHVAVDAWRTFGKGRHPAGLNYGDCFAYALAHHRDESLLCVGDDLPLTDLAVLPRRLAIDQGSYEVPPDVDAPLPADVLDLFA